MVVVPPPVQFGIREQRGPLQLEPHTFGPPEPQRSPVGQVPQSMMPLQPSVAIPQLNFWSAQVFGVHIEPQTPDVPPPPQVSLPVHAPQSMRLPHVSLCMPQLKPWSAQVFAMHT